MDFDVIVIGAGLSGLSAAWRLAERDADLKVGVFEAKDRFGGRTLTVEVETVPNGPKDSFDLGGHWVSDSQKHIMDLLKALDIGYYPQNVKGKKVLQIGDGRIRTYDSDIPNVGSWIALIQMHFLIKKVESLAQKLDIHDPFQADPELAKHYDAMTAATFLRNHFVHESVYQMFNAGILAVLGCEITQVSMLFLLAYANSAGGFQKLLLVENESAQQYKVKGGTQQITSKLIDRLGRERLHLNKTITRINQLRPEAVEVTCLDGSTFICRRIICTIPVNQRLKIDYLPPLPMERKSLYKQMIMGNLCKVYLFYEVDFWNRDGFSGEAVCYRGPFSHGSEIQQPICIIYDATTSSGVPVLKTFLAGQSANYWMGQPEEARKEAILAQVESYFGPKARQPVKYIEKTWVDEDNIDGGPVVYAPPGAMVNFPVIRKPLGSIHFAGTASATQWCGYLSGAVQSGYRAAAEVLQDINPTKLHREDQSYLKPHIFSTPEVSIMGTLGIASGLLSMAIGVVYFLTACQ
eukprot:snap_masked-scaffold1889_size25432-processed-gene-0.0 protein:Tk10566 transcript:snap_masked-scaffold1889_size25432-processed-gene-0.0-mRNA-1 annotation:"hypothetical protein DAPPUDRAFT_300978"